jgi:hypothetical protein
VSRTFLRARDRAPQEKLARKDSITSIEFVGHVVNLSAFVECVLNKQLFFEREAGKLDGTSFQALDRSEALPKLLFLFKDEIASRELPIDRIRALFSLRNLAVHFKSFNREQLRATTEELNGIWSQVSRLLAHVKGDPDATYFDGLASKVRQRWFE